MKLSSASIGDMRLLPYIIGSGGDSSRSTSAPTADAFWGLDEDAIDDSYIDDKVGTQDLLRNLVLKVSGLPASTSYWQYNGETPSYASASDSATLSLPDADFTIGAWVRLDSNPTDTASRIMSKGIRASAATFEYCLTATGATPNKFAFSLGNGLSTPIVTHGQEITLGEWYYVIGRLDKSEAKIGINVNMAGWVEAVFSGTVYNGTNDFYLGTEAALQLHWTGAINMAFIENSLLSDEQLNFWYREGLGWQIPTYS